MYENSLFLYGFPNSSTNLEKNNNFYKLDYKNNPSNEKIIYYSSNSKIENKNLSGYNIISKLQNEIFVNIKFSKKKFIFYFMVSFPFFLFNFILFFFTMVAFISLT